ncbi:hypothetical protein D3C73_680140 [compost metagenome]
MYVAFEILEAPPIAHHPDHVGVVLELGDAVLHHARIVRTQHTILAGMKRQADVRATRQLADGGEPRRQLLLDPGVAIEIANLLMAVERQKVAAQAQHAQGRRQPADIFQQAQLRGQIMQYDFQQSVSRHLWRDRVHPAEGGSTRVQGTFERLEFRQRQLSLWMLELAGKTYSRQGHGGGCPFELMSYTAFR